MDHFKIAQSFLSITKQKVKEETNTCFSHEAFIFCFSEAKDILKMSFLCKITSIIQLKEKKTKTWYSLLATSDGQAQDKTSKKQKLTYILSISLFYWGAQNWRQCCTCVLMNAE